MSNGLEGIAKGFLRDSKGFHMDVKGALRDFELVSNVLLDF